MNITTNSTPDWFFPSPDAVTAPQWMHQFIAFRKRLFLQTVEPIIVFLLGPCVEEGDHVASYNKKLDDDDMYQRSLTSLASLYPDETDPSSYHRRLNFLPSYVLDQKVYKETNMSFATLMMLFITMSAIFMVFLSCFYHNQKTSPFFVSPRRHRLPKLVPPPLPVDGFFSWVKVCFFLSDEEIINRIGYDSLIFMRFHRLALRCIVKMSLFSFVVLLPLNFTGGGKANAQDLKEYVGSLFFTDFLRYSMANLQPGSPRLWVHCFAAYLLTAIVVRELLIEYETFNSIRHRYLLSREPHLRTVLVSNIPRNLRSPRKITSYFKHVYPNAVKGVYMCQNLLLLERLVAQRTGVLSLIETELYHLCRREKKKLYETSWTGRMWTQLASRGDPNDLTQDRLATLYSQLEELNVAVEQEQARRRRVMKMMDRMEAGEGSKDIDYVLASPFVSSDHEMAPQQRKVLGLAPTTPTSQQTTTISQMPATIVEGEDEEASLQHEMSPAAAAHQEPPLMLAPGASTLRSRSPPVVSLEPGESPQVFVELDELDKKKKSRRPLTKAKNAIRRYGRFNRGSTLLGRPLRSPASQGSHAADHEHMEDHLNEVTDKAFVVMRTYTAATIAIQSMHSSKPGSMQVATAPEPRDILWDNIYMSKGAHRTRYYIGEFVVNMLICFYVVPIATVSLLVSESALVSSSPRLAQLDQASAIFSVAIAMVQPLCIVGLQQLLPPLFVLIGRAEGRTSFSDVQMQAFSRYFYFQVLNVFLVTCIAGTVFDTIAIILENPETAFAMLGNSLPRMSSFFITFVTIKTFLGLGVELSRIVSLMQGIARYILFPNATLRFKRRVLAGLRAVDDPGWFPFHKILAQDMLVVVIGVVFAVVAPLVLFPCALFFLFSRVMWTHQHLFVYESCFETGGQFFPKIFRRFVFGLIIAQSTITGQFILKEARHQAYATIFLMCLTYFFLRSTRARYDPTSSTLPLEVATVMDITLKQEEEARKAYLKESGAEGVGDSSNDPGRYIGRHDPFRKAYLQPALRANPRARPEQPFPPAQLGREETFFTDTGGMEDDSQQGMQDSQATVRLVNMDQSDRRTMNRWWAEQFYRAGEQNFFMVLFGEECGTLSLTDRYDEMHEAPVPAASHTIV